MQDDKPPTEVTVEPENKVENNKEAAEQNPPENPTTPAKEARKNFLNFKLTLPTVFTKKKKVYKIAFKIIANHRELLLLLGTSK